MVEEIVEVDTLMPAAVIAMAAGLDWWRAGIYEKLAGLLTSGKCIRGPGVRKLV